MSAAAVAYPTIPVTSTIVAISVLVRIVITCSIIGCAPDLVRFAPAKTVDILL
jgi:hypothetical protein